MYGEFVEYVPLTEENILRRVSQEDIIEMVLGYKPVPYQRITSPLPHRQNDKTPGAWFEWYNNKLMFQDFGDTKTHRAPIMFVKDYYNVTYTDALKLINQHFGLGLGDTSRAVAPKRLLLPQELEPSGERDRAIILYKPRALTIVDGRYWSKFHITRENLIEDDVYACYWTKVYSTKINNWVVTRPKDITYAFAEFAPNVKIYRPNEPTGKYKFITNCSENDIGGYKKLPPGRIRRLIVKKSYKDCRIMRNLQLISIWFQNEGCVPSENIILELIARCDEIIIWFDNDVTGILQTQKLCNIFNAYKPGIAKSLWLPEHLLEQKIKDPSDLVAKKSLRELEQFLRIKGLYGTDTPRHP